MRNHTNVENNKPKSKILFSDATCIQCEDGKFSVGGNSTCKTCTECQHQEGYHGGSTSHKLHLVHSSCSKTQDAGKIYLHFYVKHFCIYVL